MKKLNLKLLSVLFIASTFLISCSDDDKDDTVQLQSITKIAQSNPNLSILVSALVRTNLATTLDQQGTYTVFAPTNASFTAFLSQNGFAKLEDVPTAVLKEVLLNHVLATKVESKDIATGYVKTLAKGSASSTNTISMYINKNTAVVINGGKTNKGATVTTADIMASNGVIHVVDAVIALPTIVSHAAANPNFSTLVTVVTSPAQAAIATALTTNTTALTVFAPTNAAFTTALGVGGFANGATDAQISKVLQYHVTAAGNVLAGTLTNGQVIPMITNPVQNITIDLTAGAKITDKSATKANIIVTDVQCANGVIHAIDKVLQPTL